MSKPNSDGPAVEVEAEQQADQQNAATIKKPLKLMNNTAKSVLPLLALSDCSLTG